MDTLERTAILRVHRPLDSAALLRAVSVTVDGRRVARVRRGRSVSVDVPPGDRVVRAVLDWVNSEPLTVTLRDGRPAAVEVAVPARMLYQMWTRPWRALDIRGRR